MLQRATNLGCRGETALEACEATPELTLIQKFDLRAWTSAKAMPCDVEHISVLHT